MSTLEEALQRLNADDYPGAQRVRLTTFGMWLKEEDEKLVLAETRRLVAEFFKGDEEKVALWFSSPNPQFGAMSPTELLDCGKAVKLLQTVKSMLAENEREEKI